MNAGKSSLWNLLVNDVLPKHQLVHDFDGVTRDCVEAPGKLGDMWLTIIDTPGAVDKNLVEEARRTIETADLAIFITAIDVEEVTEDERAVAQLLRARRLPTVLLVNKMDLLLGEGPAAVVLQRENLLQKYDELTLGNAIPFSVRKGQGVDTLIQAVAPIYHLMTMERTKSDWNLEDAAMDGNEGAMDTILQRNSNDKWLRVAIIGRPNSGKSTLFNRLLGFERSRSSEEAGTTRDALEVSCYYKGKRIKLIDTAGMLRHKHIRNSEFQTELDKLSRAVIRHAHICVVVFDATQGHPSKTDLMLCHHCIDEGRPFLLVANKWDRVIDPAATAEAIDFKLRRQIHEVKYSNAVVVSAWTGMNLKLLLDELLHLDENWNRHIHSKELTRFWRRMEKAVVIPKDIARIVELKQVKTRPPTFLLRLQTRDQFALLKGLHLEFLKNALAEEFSFRGVPIRIIQEVKPNHPDYI